MVTAATKLKAACSLEEKLWQPGQCIKKQRYYFTDKGLSIQSYGFASSHVWMWELDHNESRALKNWCFWTVVLEKSLEIPLHSKINPVNPKWNQSWIFIGRTDTEAEAPILRPPDAKNWLVGKDPDAGKDWRQEEKGTTNDEMVGWHHRLDGREFEQSLGVGDWQGCLEFCTPWGHKELNMTEWLNWTDFQEYEISIFFLKMWREKNKQTLCTLGTQIGAATMENNLAVPQKIKNRTTIWSSNSTSRYISSVNENSLLRHACIPMFISALFTVAKIRKQLKCPSAYELIKQRWCTCSEECYSATRQAESVVFARKMVDRVVDITWREIS